MSESGKFRVQNFRYLFFLQEFLVFINKICLSLKFLFPLLYYWFHHCAPFKNKGSDGSITSREEKFARVKDEFIYQKGRRKEAFRLQGFI